MSLPFIDLKSQFVAIESDVRARVNRVFDHGQYIMGPEVEELEQNLYLKLQSMKEGEITEPEIFNMMDNSMAYRIVYLMDKLEFHI